MKHDKIFKENFLCLRNYHRKFQRKAQGLPMSVIVLAVLALLILVVLAFIFMSRMGVFSTGVSECKSQGGMCAEQCGEGSAVNNPTEYGPASGACEKINVDKPLCCIPITG